MCAPPPGPPTENSGTTPRFGFEKYGAGSGKPWELYWASTLLARVDENVLIVVSCHRGIESGTLFGCFDVTRFVSLRPICGQCIALHVASCRTDVNSIYEYAGQG